MFCRLCREPVPRDADLCASCRELQEAEAELATLEPEIAEPEASEPAAPDAPANDDLLIVHTAGDDFGGDDAATPDTDLGVVFSASDQLGGGDSTANVETDLEISHSAADDLDSATASTPPPPPPPSPTAPTPTPEPKRPAEETGEKRRRDSVAAARAHLLASRQESTPVVGPGPRPDAAGSDLGIDHDLSEELNRRESMAVPSPARENRQDIAPLNGIDTARPSRQEPAVEEAPPAKPTPAKRPSLQRRRAPPPRRRKRGRGILLGMVFGVMLVGVGAAGYYYVDTDGEMPWVAARFPALARLLNRTPAAGPGDSTTGHLIITNLGGDATVWINDQFMTGDSYDLQAGRYDIRVVAPGHDPYAATVTVTAGDTLIHSVAQEVTAQCENLFEPGYNHNQACFDESPNFREALHSAVFLTSSLPQHPTRPAILAVQVLPDGTPGTVIVKDPSDVAQYSIQAVAYAKSITYAPATRNGSPVMGWAELSYYAQRRP